MKETKTNLYEGMYVLNAQLNDEARTKVFNKIQNGITSRGGEILKIHDQGRKKLAGEINGHRDGYYYLFYFTLKPSEISHLWSEYHLMEEIIRFMTLRAEKVLEKIEFKALAEQ